MIDIDFFEYILYLCLKPQLYDFENYDKPQ